MRIVAAFDAGDETTTIAERCDVTIRTVQRVLKKHGRSARGRAGEAGEKTAAVARMATVGVVVNEFTELVAPAFRRLKAMLRKGAEPHPVQFQAVKFVVDRILPSADAKENTRAASASADRMVEHMAGVFADDAELAARMQSIERVQDMLVEQRRPHIVNPPDAEAV